MKEMCPVCKTECANGATVCSACEFTDGIGINRTWLNPEDLNDWLETVVKPHRVQWEAKKKEAALRAQLEEAEKKNAALLEQIEKAKKQEAALLKQSEESRKRETDSSAKIAKPPAKYTGTLSGKDKGFGWTYTGDIENGQRHGRGKCTWSDGDVYEGDWIGDKQHGKGKYTWASGAMYEGDWSDGKQHGKGKHTWASGDVDEGDFVDRQFSNLSGRSTPADYTDEEWDKKTTKRLANLAARVPIIWIIGVVIFIALVCATISAIIGITGSIVGGAIWADYDAVSRDCFGLMLVGAITFGIIAGIIGGITNRLDNDPHIGWVIGSVILGSIGGLFFGPTMLGIIGEGIFVCSFYGAIFGTICAIGSAIDIRLNVLEGLIGSVIGGVVFVAIGRIIFGPNFLLASLYPEWGRGMFILMAGLFAVSLGITGFSIGFFYNLFPYTSKKRIEESSLISSIKPPPLVSHN